MAAPITPVLDSFTRAAEKPLASGWEAFYGEDTGETNGTQLTPAIGKRHSALWPTIFSGLQQCYLDITTLAAATLEFGVESWLELFVCASFTESKVSGYSFFYSPRTGEFVFLKTVAGTETVMGSAKVTLEAGDKLFLERNTANQIILWRNHSGVWAEVGKFTDSTLTGGHIGWAARSANTPWALDNFGGGSVARVTKPADQTGTKGVAITPLAITGTNLHLLTAKNLPAGLSLVKVSETEWKIEGTPTTVETPTVTLEPESAGGQTSLETVTFKWTVSAGPPALTNPGTQTSVRGTAIGGFTVTNTGGAVEAGGWSIEGQPPGITINSTTGAVSGTPTAAGAYSTTVKAKNASGTAEVTFIWNVNEPAAGSQTVVGPMRQQEVIQPAPYRLRHVAPKQTLEGEPGIIDPLGNAVTVLSKQLYAAPLPISRQPHSPDLTEGEDVMRLLDAGDFTVTFPNKDASDGQPWRSRFDDEGHVEFIEIWKDDSLEFVGVIVKVVADRQKVTVSGFDGLFLLKKAYEQELVVVIAPRDLMELVSMVALMLLAQAFEGPGHSFPPGWSASSKEGGTVTFAPGAIITLPAAKAGGSLFAITGLSGRANSRWAIRVDYMLTGQIPFLRNELELFGEGQAIHLSVREGIEATLSLLNTTLGFELSVSAANLELGPGTHSMVLECDGRWVSAYVDGRLIGLLPTPTVTLTELRTGAQRTAGAAGTTVTVTINKVVLREQAPFLMRGATKGDYVLPGTSSTYPFGGLHARWFAAERPGDANWLQTVLAPDPRRTGYPEFVQTETALEVTEPPAGVPSEFFGVRFFGSIYLDFAHNATITLKFTVCKHGAIRAWFGKTQFGDQLVDSWAIGEERVVEVILKASTYGAKAGWFPIIVEVARAAAPSLGTARLEVKAATGWTDPGGTAIPSGTMTLVPTTSLSALGCVDARIQGASHFDTLQETAKNYGYQFRAEMRQLESGEFPCQVIPRAHIGLETDEVIEADDVDRHAGINNYSASFDSTDSATSMRGFGSGIADGKGSQIAFEAISLLDLEASLFDLQAWLGASDVAFPELLAALVEAQLGVRLGTWENVEGEPIARDRLADTFPLTGVLSQFKWLPGDGVRLWLSDVGVRDTANRQIMQVARKFLAEGRNSTSVGFRSRAKDAVYAIRQAVREATRPQRSYQRQYKSRSSEFITGGATPAGGFTNFLHMPIKPNEKVVAAILHLTTNTTSQKIGLEVNSILQTTSLGGPWTAAGAEINVLRAAEPSTGTSRVFMRFKNEGAAETVIEGQLELILLT